MTMTGLSNLDRAVHKTNEWLLDLAGRLGTDDRQQAYQALRAVLHALRDRLSVSEASQLAAELPLVLRGVFFEGWAPAARPSRVREVDEFIADVRERLAPVVRDEAEAFIRGVFKLLAARVSAGEICDVQKTLPEPLGELWP